MALPIQEVENLSPTSGSEKTSAELEAICTNARDRYFSTCAPQIPNTNGIIKYTPNKVLAKVCANAQSAHIENAQKTIQETNNNVVRIVRNPII